jgi:phospholipid/cholesterol/gamma-HCH transport system substrate-binding protein
MRQHALGPRPIDPNLIAQGIPPDDRVDFNDRIFAPTEGTPLPQGAGPPAPAPPDAVAPQAPEQAPVPVGPPTDGIAPPDTGGAPAAAPSAFNTNNSGPSPSIAIAHYDPQTGQYATADGQVGRQTDLVDPAKTWQDLIYRADR